MSTYKVNVSLPHDLVDKIDAAAGEEGLSRSGFIAEASAHYLTAREQARAEEQRRVDIEKAIATFRSAGASIPKDTDFVQMIREQRERRRVW